MSVVLVLGCAPVADPSAGMSVRDAVALIDHAPRSSLSLEAVAEAFALATRATSVQREMLQSELVGHAVEWMLPVYEVEFSDGQFTVTSQSIPITDAEAVPLLRVVAFVRPQHKADDVMLRALRTNDVIHIRGIVQEIRLRTVVTIVPAVVVGSKPT